MITCSICHEDVSCDFKVLFHHLKLVHNITDRNGRYTCCQQQCNRTFGSKFAFRRHVESIHPEACLQLLSTVGQVVSNPDVVAKPMHDTGATNVDEVEIESVVGCDLAAGHSSINDLACKFVCQAK